VHLVFGCVGRSTVHAYLVGTTVVDRLTRKKKAWMDRTKSRIGYESLGIELGYANATTTTTTMSSQKSKFAARSGKLCLVDGEYRLARP